MTREDLFLAIGEVSESRLARSELTAVSPSHDTQAEGKNMKQHISMKRVIRNVLVAALIVSMLAVTALAATGFLLFDDPAQMLSSLFGDETGYDHSAGSITHHPDGESEMILVEPTFDRVPVDETLVKEELEPLVEAVGQSVNWYGYTLTVDAHIYDAATRCGLVTYTLTNPDGIRHYEVQTNGEVYFPGGEIVYCSQASENFIIQEKTTDTTLAVACYYHFDERWDDDLELTLSQWAAMRSSECEGVMEELTAQVKKNVTAEEAYQLVKNGLDEESFALALETMTEEEIIAQGYVELACEEFNRLYECTDKITIDLNAQSELKHINLAEGAVTVSAIAMRVDGPMLGKKDVDSVRIRYTDGTEYVVCEDYTLNYTDASWNEDDVLTISFNRIIDVEKINAVILDGVEYPA